MIRACRSRIASLGSARPGALAALGLALAMMTLGGAVLSGCTPEIGSSCVLSTDCSSQGDRVCDTAEPNGYCTVQGCKANECPDEAACVDFNASLPGCEYSDRSPSRLSVAFCMAQCHTDSDCRSDTDENGRRYYICADPRLSPWQALILDDDQTQKVCIPNPDPGVVIGGDAGIADFDAAVCQLVSPILLEAGTAGAVDSGAADAGDLGDATVDAGSPSDAGHD